MRSVRADQFLGTPVLFIYWRTRLVYVASENGTGCKTFHSNISDQFSDVRFVKHESWNVVHFILDSGLRSCLYLLDDRHLLPLVSRLTMSCRSIPFVK